MIEYGRYLVYGPMHCAYCHTPKSQHKALDAGETLPLIGQMSDADLRAVISYLRSQPPVRHEVPDHELTLLGKTVLATVLKPKGPSSPPPAESPPVAPTVERGRYLAHVAGQCFSCHTDRNLMDGTFTGAPFAGGHPFPSTADPSIVYVSANLTPDPETGVLAR